MPQTGPEVEPAICLEFTNTNSAGRNRGEPDALQAFGDLAAWLDKHGACPHLARLKRWARQNPAKADRLLARAKRLREAVYSVMSAHAALSAPERKDVDTVATEAAAALGSVLLVGNAGSYVWQADSSASPESLCLSAVALSAAALLTGPDLPRVRECANETCGWLFLDQSKSQTRKWCDMSDCGNKMKARRHYARVKAAKRKR